MSLEKATFVSEQQPLMFGTCSGGAAADCPHGCIAWPHTFLTPNPVLPVRIVDQLLQSAGLSIATKFR